MLDRSSVSLLQKHFKIQIKIYMKLIKKTLRIVVSLDKPLNIFRNTKIE